MQQLILVIHVLVALSIVALILLQQGKGADIGATFGGGASNTVFGSRGAVPFLMKMTTLLAAIFFATSIGLSYMAQRDRSQNNAFNMNSVPVPAQQVPVTGNQQPSKQKI